MSGLAKLEARIEALRWAADQVEGMDGVGEPSVLALRHMADGLASACDLVRPDYVAEPEPEEEEPATEASAELSINVDTAALRCAVDASEAPEIEPEPEPEPTPEEDADTPAEPLVTAPKPVTVPAAVIRAWAQKQGIPVGARGPIQPGAMRAINDRRRLEGLAPFIQKAGT
jgi:hypothetical protein